MAYPTCCKCCIKEAQSGFFNFFFQIFEDFGITSSGVATGGQGGQSAPLDSEKFATIKFTQ